MCIHIFRNSQDFCKKSVSKIFVFI
ncbi:MAG: hypothetical protein GY795_36430 [Desulfobacterales bacterium]|nr:hypothetical protein [Desulfobacterales bacterium]